jgi:uncharacterized membrane protein
MSQDKINLDMDDVFTEEVKARIEAAIQKAEHHTSAELRVHIENECPEDPLDRASFIFAELGMHKTKLRNGVLIYLALRDRKLAIIGDAGINSVIAPNSWNTIYHEMANHFKSENFEQGVIAGVELVGKAIQTNLPIERNDRNELSNQVTTGKSRKS